MLKAISKRYRVSDAAAEIGNDPAARRLRSSVRIRWQGSATPTASLSFLPIVNNIVASWVPRFVPFLKQL